jgi:hypothetical protein
MKLNLDRLPRSARHLAEVIGLDAVLVLVAHCGGREVFPARADTRAHLGELLGETIAQKLADTYRGDPIRVPQCKDALRVAYQDDMRAEYDRRTRAGESSRSVVQDLAARPPYYYDWRTVTSIVNRADVGGKTVEVSQQELF